MILLGSYSFSLKYIWS